MDLSTYRDTAPDRDDNTPPTSPQHLEPVTSLVEELEVSQRSGPLVTTDATVSEMYNLDLNRPQDVPVRKQPNVVIPEQSIPTLTHYGTLEHLVRGGAPYDPSKAGPLEGRRLGYDPHKLLHSAISCQPCRLSDLRYAPKLSIFRPENFQDVPDSILKVLEPALALAERMILQGNPRFWMDVACGRREVDRAKTTMASTVHQLQRLGEGITFKFDYLENVYGICGCRTFFPAVPADKSRYFRPGELWSSTIFMCPILPKTDVWNENIVIRFTSELHAVAEKFAKLQNPDVASQLRFNFFFASNLCHEIAHAFENKCGNAHYADEISRDRKKAAREGILAPHYQGRFIEALYKHYPNEMGVAWEYDTFGGRLEPINSDKESRYGLHVFVGGARSAPWSGSRSAMAGLTPYGRALPMAYIEELQQTSFWANTIGENGIVVPKYGPETYLMSTTTTYTWRQHLLDYDPTYQSAKRTADLIADLRDALPETPFKRQKTTSQPPCRRLTATRRLVKVNKSQLFAKSHTRATPLSARHARHRFPPPTSTPSSEGTIHNYPGFDYIHVEDHDLTYFMPVTESEPQTYDPLFKPASQLTVADKWLLCEEWAALVKDWPSHEFLSWRSLYQSYPETIGLFQDFPPGLIPGSQTDNCDEHTLTALREYRQRFPERSLAARKARQDLEHRARMTRWKTLAEMEEYIALKGFSRILFMHRFAAGKPLGFGMTLENWEQEYRPLLLLERESGRSMAH